MDRRIEYSPCIGCYTVAEGFPGADRTVGHCVHRADALELAWAPELLRFCRKRARIGDDWARRLCAAFDAAGIVRRDAT